MANHRIRLRGPWQYHQMPRSFSLNSHLELASIEGLEQLQNASSKFDTVSVPDGWSLVDFDGINQVLIGRSFNKPSGIEPNQKLFIQVEADPQPTGLFLNGQNIPVINHLAEISGILLDTNWLILEFAELNLSKDSSNTLFDEVRLLIVE